MSGMEICIRRKRTLTGIERRERVSKIDLPITLNMLFDYRPSLNLPHTGMTIALCN